MNPDQMSGWFVLLLGMGTVFVGLIILIVLTRIMSAVITHVTARRLNARPSDISARAASYPPPDLTHEPVGVIANRPEFIAAVSAAVAVSAGLHASGLRIHSVKQITAGDDGAKRAEMMAAMAAVIADYTGKGTRGLRIHSIRKI